LALNSKNCFKDIQKGKEVPDGYKKISCHFLFDVKFDGRHKSRFVAGGHWTIIPVGSVYSGVLSLEGIQVVTLLAEMNDMELWATDVGNIYLESYTEAKGVLYRRSRIWSTERINVGDCKSIIRFEVIQKQMA
jgi:hypothetical protein